MHPHTWDGAGAVSVHSRGSCPLLLSPRFFPFHQSFQQPLCVLLDRAGRTGTAYSLFTREELPYVLDLHLFLGRRLAPAPRRSLNDAATAAVGDTGSESQDTSLFGSFPLVHSMLAAAKFPVAVSLL